MEILLFKFNKKANSTKVPNDSDGVTVHVDVKQNVMGGREGFSKDCFVVTPTFFISATSGLTPDKATCYNYCKAFGRYYFIRNAMVDISNAITLFCEVDALATLKTEILATTARVLYSTSHGSAQIDDKRNGPTANAEVDWETEEMFTQTGGTYLLNVVGSDNQVSATPFSITYAFTDWATAHLVSNALLDGTVMDSLVRWVKGTTDFVVSLKWTPITLPDSVLSALDDVYIGPLNLTQELSTPVKGKKLLVRHLAIGPIHLNIPKRYSDYRQSAKYVEYILNVPYCGAIKFPPGILKNLDYIAVTPILDLITGDLAVRITTDNGIIIGTMSGNAYSDVPLGVESFMGKGALSAISAGLAVGAAVVTAGTSVAIAGEAAAEVSSVTRTAYGVAGLATAAQSAIGIATIQQAGVTVGGALSSAVGGIAVPVLELVEIAYDSVFNPSDLQATRGLPYGKAILLSNLSGYCQTEGAALESTDYVEIIYIARRQMDAGFYIE